MEKISRCSIKGHRATLLECDLSKAYKTNKPYFMVRCDTKKTCCFGDYFTDKNDAIKAWNEGHKNDQS